jgi:hypothetical protein
MDSSMLASLGGGGGGGGGRRKFLEFQPYTPKDRQARTAVTFNCFVHPMFLNAGERVAMRINCHGLGNMEEAIPMVQSPIKPAISTLQLQHAVEIRRHRWTACRSGWWCRQQGAWRRCRISNAELFSCSCQTWALPLDGSAPR